MSVKRVKKVVITEYLIDGYTVAQDNPEKAVLQAKMIGLIELFDYLVDTSEQMYDTYNERTYEVIEQWSDILAKMEVAEYLNEIVENKL